MAQSIDLSIATQPNNLGDVPRLIEELGALQRSLEAGGNDARHDMFLKARSLVQSLSTPRELMVQHTWADVSPCPQVSRESSLRSSLRQITFEARFECCCDHRR